MITVKPLKLEDIPATRSCTHYYGVGCVVEVLDEFVNSSNNACEVFHAGEYQNSNNFCRAFLTVIQRNPSMYSDVKCCIRGDRVFLVRKSALQKC